MGTGQTLSPPGEVVVGERCERYLASEEAPLGRSLLRPHPRCAPGSWRVSACLALSATAPQDY